MGWVYGVVRRKMRGLTRRGFYAFEKVAADPRALRPQQYTTDNPYHSMRRALWRAVRSLPASSRRVVYAIYVQDIPIKDVAKHDGTFTATIQRRRQKALDLLRLALKEEGYPSTDISG